jgi:hypothetical protein
MPNRVLFVGAIDGKVELEFLTTIRSEATEVFITSYLGGPELVKLVDTFSGGPKLVAIEGVDATALSNTFGELKFNAIAWLGPTNDDNKGQTAALVGAFVRSAAQVLKPGGTVYVLQDLRTPNFRDIVKIPGAHFLCQVSLDNRTQTQSSSSTSKKVMAGRKDHLFAFHFDDSAQIVDVNNEGNAKFEGILTTIMQSNSDMLKKVGTGNGCGAYSKKEIADMIFEYAST